MCRKIKMLYILNIANKVNNFSYASMVAAQKMEIEFHIAGNWSYSSKDERKADEIEYGIKIHQIDFIREPYNLKNIKAYTQLLSLVKSERYDMIHSNTPIGGVLGRVVGKQCKIKTNIYQAHGFHFYKGAPMKNWMLYYPIERWLAHYTDALITINQEDYEVAQKFKLKNGGKVYYVPGVGIDLKQYQSGSIEAARTKQRAELGLDEKDTICISMGDLIPRKNYSVAISTIGRLQERYPNLHYIICGKGQELDNLKKVARDCGVENKVHFLGFRSDIKELLKVADVFLFTSLQEGLPRSTMEAMASGLPIACSRIRGNTDLIEEEKGGVLFDPENADEIASALDKLLSSDMEAMSRYNLDKIQEFSLDVATAKMTTVYQSEFSEKSWGGLSEIMGYYSSWYKKRLELGLKATDTVLISVGRLDKNKNNSTLIKAVGLCSNPAIHLVICGDGEEKDKLINLANTLGIASQIHFLGNCSDMEELYSIADIFVMASYREGLSRSIMEAMASGLPCIVSDIRGNRDLIKQYKGGYLVNPIDIRGFAKDICFLKSNKRIIKQMQDYNCKSICKFSLCNVSDCLTEIYENILV